MQVFVENRMAKREACLNLRLVNNTMAKHEPDDY